MVWRWRPTMTEHGGVERREFLFPCTEYLRGLGRGRRLVLRLAFRIDCIMEVRLLCFPYEGVGRVRRRGLSGLLLDEDHSPKSMSITKQGRIPFGPNVLQEGSVYCKSRSKLFGF